MCGQHYDGAGACRVKMRCGKKRQHVAELVRLNLVETDLGESFCKPCRSCLFTKGRSRNLAEIGLPVEYGFGISMEPRESVMHSAHGGERSDTCKGRSCGRRRHSPIGRVAGLRPYSGYSTECRNSPRAGAVGPAAARARAAI